jgi:hypothetical protein
MFAGHVGAALAIGSAERRVNVGAFVAAALLLDVVLWFFVLVGWESVVIPAESAQARQPEFSFPWSHGLAAGLAWSGIAAAAGGFGYAHLHAAKWRAAALVAAAVFSPWLLDALVHPPELPLAGEDSAKIGLDLGRSTPVARALETAVVVAGIWLFLPESGLPRGRRLGLAALAVLVLIFTLAGMTIAPPPPSASAMAGGSLVTLIVVCALALWLGRVPRAGSD